MHSPRSGCSRRRVQRTTFGGENVLDAGLAVPSTIALTAPLGARAFVLTMPWQHHGEREPFSMAMTDSERAARVLMDDAASKWVRPMPSPSVKSSPWVIRALSASLPAADRTGSLTVLKGHNR